MKPFLNIISDSKTLKVPLKYNQYSSYTNVEDKTLPTLVIGYGNAKDNINGFTILKKWYCEQNIGWTFSKKERGFEHQSDIDDFCEGIITNIINRCSYALFDPFTIDSVEQVKRFIKFINNNSDKFVYIDKNDFLFIYSKLHKRSYGISLSNCEFCGIEKEKIIDRIFSNSHNRKISNFRKIPYSLRNKVGNRPHILFALLEFYLDS